MIRRLRNLSLLSMHAKLRYLPIPFFSVTMGLGGLAIALGQAATTLSWPALFGHITLALAALLFVALVIGYALKIAHFRDEVAAELAHPIKLNFFPAFSISLLVLSTAFLDPLPGVSQLLWIAGASIHLLFTLYVMSVWIHHTRFQIDHLNPAWFIPVVGNILVPIAGVEHASLETGWFYFSIGLLYWLVLLSLFFNRAIFHQPLPERFVPTLFILIAPPAVGFIAYLALNGGELDSFARVLYYSALFTTLLLVTQVRTFAALPFSLSWWAYSFPIAAVTIATLLMYQLLGGTLFLILSWALLLLLIAVILMLVVRTVMAIGAGGIFVAD